MSEKNGKTAEPLGRKKFPKCIKAGKILFYKSMFRFENKLKISFNMFDFRSILWNKFPVITSGSVTKSNQSFGLFGQDPVMFAFNFPQNCPKSHFYSYFSLETEMTLSFDDNKWIFVKKIIIFTILDFESKILFTMKHIKL